MEEVTGEENLVVGLSQIRQHAPQHTMIGVIVWVFILMFAVPYRAEVVVHKVPQ